jgi:hypothetical protein
MALKKGKATDAVAKLFSVPAVETKEELHMPEAHEAHEAYEVQAQPRMPHMPDTHEVYEASAKHPMPEAYEAHEAYEAEPYSAMTTQGKKGKKAQRMTMAFSEENMAYIRTMGKLESGGATAYVNRLIEADRQKNADVYRQMKALLPDA